MADLNEDILREPPVSGDEISTLLGALERQRATLAWKCSGLDARADRRRGLMQVHAIHENVPFDPSITRP